jgi:hypothetical protein
VRRLIEEQIFKQTSRRRKQVNSKRIKKLDLKLSLNLNVWLIKPISIVPKQKPILLLRELQESRL